MLYFRIDLQMQLGNSVQIPKSVQEKIAMQGEKTVAVF